jgi:fibronectin type 3 domain-containing protein
VTAQSSASPSSSATASVTVLPPVVHSVALSWNSSTSSVAGYNIYRGTQPTGAFTKLNSLIDTATLYTDINVVSGNKYYYAATSDDSNGVESQYSNIAQASIP